MAVQKLNRSEKSWILYDVANSAFTLLISSTIPIFFSSLTQASGIAPEHSTALWGSVTSISVLILAVLSPILGALADYGGMKKKLFVSFLILGLIGLISLSVATEWAAFLCLFVVARVGYAACNVFYDSMLTDVTTNDQMDMVSSHGYAWGYIGSCVPFVIGIALIFLKPFGLTTQSATQVSFLITALWWLLLTIPLLCNVKQVHFLKKRSNMIKDSFRRLGETFKKVKKERSLLFYILAYFCYIDGVYTIISMATTYGTEVGIDSTSMIFALLLTQVVAFPCAIISGKLSAKFGPIKLIKVFIIAYIGICIFGFQLDQVWEFWVLAVAVGICLGGIQALSRSHFGKLIPKEESNEYFGFFDIFGKFADFLGPLIIAVCATLFGSSSYGILALVLLFGLGFVLLLLSERAKKQA